MVGGLIVLNDDALRDQLAFHQNATGGVPGPQDCFLVLRGLKTLGVRMRQHGANALQIARFLAEHPAVARVFYPGLPTDPQHQTARRNFSSGGGTESVADREHAVNRAGFGGMVSFLARGGEKAARDIGARTRLFTLAESLGGVESLIEHPAAMDPCQPGRFLHRNRSGPGAPVGRHRGDRRPCGRPHPGAGVNVKSLTISCPAARHGAQISLVSTQGNTRRGAPQRRTSVHRRGFGLTLFSYFQTSLFEKDLHACS